VTVPFLDLSRQVEALRSELDESIAAVLDSGRFIEGETVAEFERAFAAYCGARHAVGVASGTDAITLALRAVGVVPGDEVITAANTCVPTVVGIERAGARPILVDTDEETLTLDPGELEEALTDRTQAVVPVHLYGQCTDMDAVLSFAQEHGLKVVEDAAQAHGAEYGSGRVGTFGDAAAFSFYPTKNLGALGDGGAVVTNDAEVASRVRSLRTYGYDADGSSAVSGMNSRLDALQAAVLLVKLPWLEGWNERRRSLAMYYREALAGVGLRLPVEAEGRRHVHHLFVVRSPERDVLRARLRERGVETLVHYPQPVQLHPAYRHLARPGRLERSERAAREVVSLPLYAELTDGEAEAVVSAVLE
jgi:dTDP-4-amino-4,6-dideoxygalactose transaminase